MSLTNVIAPTNALTGTNASRQPSIATVLTLSRRAQV